MERSGTPAQSRRGAAQSRVATLAAVLVAWALIVFGAGHIPLQGDPAAGAPAATASAPLTLHATHATDPLLATHGDDAAAAANDGCAACAGAEHDAAVACAVMLLLVTLLSLVTPRRPDAIVRVTPPHSSTSITIAWRPRRPDLDALGISRT